jgi:uncharacterized protein YndB with AHSA1/START domain
MADEARITQRVRSRRRRSRTIDAPPEAVWPWLVQMGFDRGGWYAIDLLEKAFGVGRFATGWSARRVEPALQGLAVGDRVPLSRRLWLDVVVLDAPRELVLVLPPGRLEWVWSFALEPEEGQRTRLTITTELSLPARGRIRRTAISAGFALFDVGHGVMEAVQFRTLARRVPAAERRSASG